MDPVVHFELPTDDRERASTFYAEAFDWTFEDTPFEDGVYTSAVTSPIDEDYMHEEAGAINGALIDRNDEIPAPVLTIGVDSIDDALEDVDAAGGSVLVPKDTVPDMGHFAYVTDSEGNVIGLWQSLTGG